MKKRSFSERIAVMRFHYHSNCIELNNVLNQLRLRSDEKAEEVAKKHTMIVIEDICPRLGVDTTKLFNEED